LYTSPHLHTPLERIKVCGEDITPTGFDRCISRVRDLVHELSINCTYFEVMTLAAAIHFKNQKVDAAVFETGLGGRYDATNIFAPRVCIITNISYDHMDVLGETIEQISAEKAAIIKDGVFTVSSPQSANAMSVIEKRCRAKNAPLVKVGQDIKFTVRSASPAGSSIDLETASGSYRDCAINIPGLFQAENCAAAVAAAEKILADRTDADGVREGIARTSLPGRLEVVGNSPRVILDAAQNEESARRLAGAVRDLFSYGRLILVAGLNRDKDIRGFSRRLRDISSAVILTRSGHPRAADPFVLKGFFRGQGVEVTSDAAEAIGRAFMLAGKNDIILVSGSFYLLSEIRDLLVRRVRTEVR
jgi:dihydrofolate synthase/folylpolyglutamate synthase